MNKELLKKSFPEFYKLLVHQSFNEELMRLAFTKNPQLIELSIDNVLSDFFKNEPRSKTHEYIEKWKNVFASIKKDGLEKTILKLRIDKSEDLLNKRISKLENQYQEERIERKKKTEVKQNDTIHEDEVQLPSFSECIEIITKLHQQETYIVQGLDTYHNTPLKRKMSRFLYRGESGQYRTTTSSLDRIFQDTSIPVDALEDILLTANRLTRDMITKWNLPYFFAQGFLQHYGMPTNYIDFTSDLNVAISFASDLISGEIGCFCVMDTKMSCEDKQIIELTSHPFADRPRRQKAYALYSKSNRDLKKKESIDSLALNWYWFRFTDADEEKYHPNFQLLDAHSDKAAGVINLAINGYGKINDIAAKWIADRLQPAPFVAYCTSNENHKPVFTWISAELAGFEYNENDLNVINYQQWSDKFPFENKSELPHGKWKTVEQINPGAILEVGADDPFGLIQVDFGSTW